MTVDVTVHVTSLTPGSDTPPTLHSGLITDYHSAIVRGEVRLRGGYGRDRWADLTSGPGGSRSATWVTLEHLSSGGVMFHHWYLMDASLWGTIRARNVCGLSHAMALGHFHGAATCTMVGSRVGFVAGAAGAGGPGGVNKVNAGVGAGERTRVSMVADADSAAGARALAGLEALGLEAGLEALGLEALWDSDPSDSGRGRAGAAGLWRGVGGGLLPGLQVGRKPPDRIDDRRRSSATLVRMSSVEPHEVGLYKLNPVKPIA